MTTQNEWWPYNTETEWREAKRREWAEMEARSQRLVAQQAAEEAARAQAAREAAQAAPRGAQAAWEARRQQGPDAATARTLILGSDEDPLLMLLGEGARATMKPRRDGGGRFKGSR